MAEHFYFDGANRAKFTHLGMVRKGQDGAIFQDSVFRFNSDGSCGVYALQTLELVDEFTLDKAKEICPHSNAVFFGTEYFADGDEFPILYSNIYNTYAKQPDRLEGVCCAYRITREQGKFTSQLVQVIRVSFVDTPLWRSENGEDIRPYGNFVMDGQNLWAYVMRDESRTTRFFCFPMPKVAQGQPDANWGVPVVTLTEQDITEQFDSCYVNFMQGGICHNGLIYSVEGFTVPNQHNATPAMRIFDTKAKKQVLHLDLVALGLTVEPEFVEVYNGGFYYADHDGNFYSVTFEKE